MKLRRMDHVGVVVKDLAAVKEFFVALGMEVMGEAEVGGEWVERIIGVSNVRATLAMLKVPGTDGTNLELTQFHSPVGTQDSPVLPSNALGLRHLTFAVEGIEAVVARLRQLGAEPFSDIQIYRDSYKLCYLRGPEGIIVELAEEME